MSSERKAYGLVDRWMVAFVLKRWITAGPYPGLAPQTWSVPTASERTFEHCVSPSLAATARIRPCIHRNSQKTPHPPSFSKN